MCSSYCGLITFSTLAVLTGTLRRLTPRTSALHRIPSHLTAIEARGWCILSWTLRAFVSEFGLFRGLGSLFLKQLGLFEFFPVLVAFEYLGEPSDYFRDDFAFLVG